MWMYVRESACVRIFACVLVYVWVCVSVYALCGLLRTGTLTYVHMPMCLSVGAGVCVCVPGCIVCLDTCYIRRYIVCRRVRRYKRVRPCLMLEKQFNGSWDSR